MAMLLRLLAFASSVADARFISSTILPYRWASSCVGSLLLTFMHFLHPQSLTIYSVGSTSSVLTTTLRTVVVTKGFQGASALHLLVQDPILQWCTD